jgi:hypothetical protein
VAATLIIWAWGVLTQGKSAQPILPAEEYIIHMMNNLRSSNNGSQVVSGSNRTDGLVMAVRRSLVNCRWELLQEAFTTLGKLLEVTPDMVFRS